MWKKTHPCDPHHARKQACPQRRTHARTRACTHAGSYAHAHACMHARMHARTHAHTHARPHARTPARPHARTNARTHARTPAHPCARAHRVQFFELATWCRLDAMPLCGLSLHLMCGVDSMLCMWLLARRQHIQQHLVRCSAYSNI